MLDADGNVIEEATEAPDPGAAQRAKFQGKDDEMKDGEEPPKKKIIRNPMPKLNPDRICGARGIGTLSDIFSDFQPKGGDHVFEDLDRAMHKMEHWAHRLYPKLPFDDVMARISVLGKKMAIQTHLKRTRMGLDPVIIGPISAKNSDNEDNGGDDKDETKRYDNDDFPTEDDFEKLIREAEANRDDAFDEFDSLTKAPSPKPKTVLSDEQKERMEKNRQMAAEKRRVRQLEAEQKLSQNPFARWAAPGSGASVREEQKSKEEDITEQKENIEDVSSLQLSSDEDEPITFINYAPKKSKIEYEDDSDDTDDEKDHFDNLDTKLRLFYSKIEPFSNEFINMKNHLHPPVVEENESDKFRLETAAPWLINFICDEFEMEGRKGQFK